MSLDQGVTSINLSEKRSTIVLDDLSCKVVQLSYAWLTKGDLCCERKGYPFLVNLME